MLDDLPPDYLTRIRARQKGLERGVPTFLHNKSAAESFVRQIGVKTNSILREFDSIESIDLSGLPAEFVLKPTFLSSTFGVMVLSESGNGWHEGLKNQELLIEDIKSEQFRYSEKSNSPDKKWIVEEKSVDATGADVPDDWKFFCFQGRIGLIHRTVRRRPRNMHYFFTGDFRPIPAGSEDCISINESIIERDACAPPANWRSLSNAARRISVAVPSPFVRVDMYNTISGPVFGEFTLVPGTFFYEDREKMHPRLSTDLGFLWEAAERDLI